MHEGLTSVYPGFCEPRLGGADLAKLGMDRFDVFRAVLNSPVWADDETSLMIPPD